MNDIDGTDFGIPKDKAVKRKISKPKPSGRKNYTFDNNKFMSLDLIDTPIYDDRLMADLLAEVARNMFIEMDNQGITLKELAKKTGMNYSYLFRIFSDGGENLGMSALIRISLALKSAPSKFFPCDAAALKTNGQRFDELTKGIDIAGENFLLGLCADYCREHSRLEKLNEIKKDADEKEDGADGLDC